MSSGRLLRLVLVEVERDGIDHQAVGGPRGQVETLRHLDRHALASRLRQPRRFHRRQSDDSTSPVTFGTLRWSLLGPRFRCSGDGDEEAHTQQAAMLLSRHATC